MQQDENPLVWPRRPDRERIQRYAHSDKLYSGDHFGAFKIKLEKDFTERYQKIRYIVGNFAGLMSRVMADMLFSQNLKIDVQDNKTQRFLDAVIEENDLYTQLWESGVCNSRRGDDVFKIRVGTRHKNDQQSSIIIEQFTPAMYFPVFNRQMARNTPEQDVIAEVFKEQGMTVLHKEIHEPGLIFHEVYNYSPDDGRIIGTLSPERFGFVEREDTKVKRSLVFHVPNVRDGYGFFGTGDYVDLESLFFGLNNRVTKIDNILDKHSDPILAVPPGVLDENGKVRKEALGMFEVDNETPGFNKPEYIVWNANLDAAEKEIDKLIDMLYMFSEVSPATLGMEKNGIAESGRALKFRMIATIRKRNRKMRYYDMALKYMLMTAQELALAHGVSVEKLQPAAPEKPQIKWNDRIVNDEVEAVDIATARIDNGTWSRSDAIADLDNISPDDAKKKVKEIDVEGGPAVPEPSNAMSGNGTGQPAVPPAKKPAPNGA
jgi:uncharacterized protein YggL (DUF469 family)